MAKRSSTKSKSKAKSLTLVVETLKNVKVPILIEPFAKSTATTGVGFSNACREHRELVKAPRVCPKCLAEREGRADEALAILVSLLEEGDGKNLPAAELADIVKRVRSGFGLPELSEENLLKAYAKGESPVFLEPTLVEELKPKSDGTVRIIQVLDQAALGGFSLGDAVLPLVKGAKVLVPVDDGKMGLPLYGALASYLGIDRVGILFGTGRGRVWYALVRVMQNKLIAAVEINKPQDVKKTTAWLATLSNAKPLPQNVRDAYASQGAQDAQGKELDLDVVNEDQPRRAMEQLILDAAEGKIVVKEVDEEEEEAAVGDDLLKLLQGA